MKSLAHVNCDPSRSGASDGRLHPDTFQISIVIFVSSWVSWYKFFWSAAPEPGRLSSRPLEREAHLTFFHPIFFQQKISINGNYLVSMNEKTSTDFSKRGRWSSQTRCKSVKNFFFTQISSNKKLALMDTTWCQ